MKILPNSNKMMTASLLVLLSFGVYNIKIILSLFNIEIFDFFTMFALAPLFYAAARYSYKKVLPFMLITIGGIILFLI